MIFDFQLPDLIETARALPDLPIVLNHLGGVIVFCDDAPLLIGQEPIPILPPVATIPCSP
jgi:hypothetical protein